MLKHLTALLLGFFGLLHPSEGSYVNTHLYPTCVGGLPNLSYAKGLQVIENSSNASCTNNNLINQSPSLTVTWFYYDSFPPVSCGNPSLPAGDQCCHSTINSTITFYKTVFANVGPEAVGTSSGIVTAGAFFGQLATWVLSKNTANLALNCDKPYGQEASVGIVTLTISNGPTCLNGALFKEQCPGATL